MSRTLKGEELIQQKFEMALDLLIQGKVSIEWCEELIEDLELDELYEQCEGIKKAVRVKYQ